MKATIVDIKKETRNTKTFFIELEQPLKFLTGQFVMLSIPDFDISRAYSISCPGGEKKNISLTIKIYPDGKLTSVIDKLIVGSAVEVKGPYGHFTFDNSIVDDLVLIAGGSGISSLHGIFCDVLENDLNNKIKLIYSVRCVEEIIFKNEIKRFSVEQDNFNSFITLTNDKSDWGDSFGRINVEMLKNEIENFNSLFYVCGPILFVKSVVEMLESLGVSKDKIKVERYG